MKVNSFLLSMVCSVLLASCAIIQPPSGGVKDETPPKIKSATPTNGATNYSKNEIELEFDEFIVLNNLQQEILISPPLKEIPEIKVTGKKLQIEFKEDLQSNTTYTISLGVGVKDYTEGNILDSNIIVFSTGESIDSGTVNGVIQDAATREYIKGTLIMLYESDGDSVPSKERPRYYAKSDQQGSFQIQFIKPGSYSVFALDDKNNNYLYDLPNERIAFLDTKITVEESDSSASNIKLSMFQEKLDNQFFKGSKPLEYGKWLLGFNQPIEELKLTIIGGNDSVFNYFLEYDKNKDTVWVWTDVQSEEALSIEISERGQILDTFNIKPIARPKDENKLKQYGVKINLNISNGIADYFDTLFIQTTKPLAKVSLHGVLIQGTDTLRLVELSDHSRRIVVMPKLKQETKYKLIVYAGSFTDVLGFENDTTTISFKTLSDMEYASLNVLLKGAIGTNNIIQLMTEKEEILKTIKGKQNLSFSNLPPGKYKLKMIFDENLNGKWDPGTFIPRKQPERVIYFSGEIEMKEGWDKKIEWIIPE